MSPLSIMLDSGAYSAHRLGVDIDLDDYIAFLKRYGQLFQNHVSLDVIPGSKGRREHRDGLIDEAARQSHENHRLMKDAGLRPIPVHHQDEDVKWLDLMLDEGEEYVGISPVANTGIAALRFIEASFNRISRHGRAVKTHSFGYVSNVGLVGFPWTSADATTWNAVPINGSIFVPVYRGGRPDFSARPYIVAMTADAASRANHVGCDGFLHEVARRWLDDIRPRRGTLQLGDSGACHGPLVPGRVGRVQADEPRV